MTKTEIKLEFDRVLTEESNAILKIINQNDGNVFEAIKLISESNKVIFTGVGKSGLIASKIAATFSSIGVPACFLHPVEALHGDLGLVQDGDVTIMLSKSGTTEELIKLYPFLSSKTKIITITSNKNSFLSNKSDVNIDASIEKEACPNNLAPMTSTTVALSIGDALAACLIKLNKFTPADFSKYHPLGQLGKNLTLKVEDIMHKGNKLPFVTESAMLKEAIIEISNKGLGIVCIIKENILIGIITDGDLRRTLEKDNDIRSLKVDEIMSKNPITISPNVSLGEALSIMENRKSQINVLPVVDEKNVCLGIIRLHDIIKTGL